MCGGYSSRLQADSKHTPSTAVNSKMASALPTRTFTYYPIWRPSTIDDFSIGPRRNKITVFSDYRGNKNVVERTKNNKVFARISYYHDSVVDLSFVTVLPAQVYLHTDQHGTIAYSTGPIISSLPVTTF